MDAPAAPRVAPPREVDPLVACLEAEIDRLCRRKRAFLVDLDGVTDRIEPAARRRIRDAARDLVESQERELRERLVVARQSATRRHLGLDVAAHIDRGPDRPRTGGR